MFNVVQFSAPTTNLNLFLGIPNNTQMLKHPPVIRTTTTKKELLLRVYDEYNYTNTRKTIFFKMHMLNFTPIFIKKQALSSLYIQPPLHYFETSRFQFLWDPIFLSLLTHKRLSYLIPYANGFFFQKPLTLINYSVTTQTPTKQPALGPIR